MEDVDTGRCLPGVDQVILRQLEAHALHWDEPVVYQSQRGPLYAAALAQLLAAGHAYPCSCSRKVAAGRYDGKCRSGPGAPPPHSFRLRVPDAPLSFTDRFAGPFAENLWASSGDFVLRRRDGLWAYQLAVTVDDEAQQITDIVRGMDLLDATPRQDYLRLLLGYRPLRHGHVRLALAPDGRKLSKQNHSPAIDFQTQAQVETNLLAVFDFLGLPAAGRPLGEGASALLAWAGQFPLRG